jgi:retron-type reverse transcriptase
MIAKPGKTPSEVTSYRPISLLQLLSKILEIIILKRLTPTLAVNKVIPSHQFGFRPKHRTTQQLHRIIHRINNDLENKRYCTAAFLDISQAFDKVWHTALFLKLKQALSHPEYTLLRSYLTNRMFQVRYQEEYTMLHPIYAGVPQGSILGPILYTIFTADLPEAEQTHNATYADDTAILASHEDPIVATKKLQTHLHRLEHWLQ